MTFMTQPASQVYLHKRCQFPSLNRTVFSHQFMTRKDHHDRDTLHRRPRDLLEAGRPAPRPRKAHTREGDAIAAAGRRLPMVEVDPTTPLVGTTGTVSLLDTFEGRTQLFASYHMWHASSLPTSAKAARSTPARRWSCRTCTRATLPSRSSARASTTRATATASSWTGICRGTPCLRSHTAASPCRVHTTSG